MSRTYALLTVTGLATVLLSAPLAVAGTPATAVSHWSGGGTTISGNTWLRGKGVTVYRSRQCTELATRLYAKRGWGSLNNIYSKRPSHRKITFRKSGRGYRPVPGDVVVEGGGSYGHVAVVRKVKKRTIFAVEQNAAPSGRKTYHLRGKKLRATGAYGTRHVTGFLTSKKNPAHKSG